MSLAVAIEHSGGVLLACDSYAGGDDWRDVQDRPKWIRSGPVVLACVGSSRACQVAQTQPTFRHMRRNEDDMRYLQAVVIEPIRGALKTDDGTEKDSGFSQIAVLRGRAYFIDHTHAIMRSSNGYCAIGAGDEFALGALHATAGMPLKARCEKAMKAAAHHCPYVAAPFHYLEVAR